MTEAEFVRLFLSDFIVGPCSLTIKKLHQGKGQLSTDLNYMPCDFLYAIYNKLTKDANT